MDYKNISVETGTPDTLGATADARGVNFAIYSKHAARVDLCLFDDDGKTEVARITLPAKTGDVWHGHVPGLKAGQVYGYRVDGPYEPQNGHRFNPQKLVLDAYAKEIVGEIAWTDAHSNPAKDNAADTVKARVTAPLQSPVAPMPKTPMADSVIYELHPKGYTVANSKIPKDLRGTYAGLASQASLDYLKDLGITAVELLPVHAKVNDSWLAKLGLKNFWGYNTLSFFAPEPEYAADKANARQEFRDMVDKFHKAGIEVILDVVYNHAAEGNENGPTLCFRGIDNATYYKLDPNDKGKYVNDTGCGNTVDTAKPVVRQMVLDSLRHWVQEYGIDGFRFDLAPVLGRDPYAFDRNAAFFKELEADPVLSKVKLIAEPWDPGMGGYQVGNFPAKWQEWNDKFRDDLRKFWKGTTDTLRLLATRLTGSAPEFDRDGRSAHTSVNFIACHDGMTLHDLVSHSYKKNLANGEDNRDGSNDNYSANNGIEGETKDPAIIAQREQQKRNLLTSLFLSQGTPMLLAGDEHGNSQKGNNNAYSQDNPLGWLDWDDITAEGQKLTAFVKKLITFRKDHDVLRSGQFMHGKIKDRHGVKDLTWINASGREQTDANWAQTEDKCIGAVFNAAAVKKVKGGERLLTVFNAHSGDVDFKLPQLKGGSGWTRVLDTANPESPAATTPLADGSTYRMPARSVVVFTQNS
ncbi:MAG: glycogen debranching protein GlgX [Micavibrio sp.]|nr:glycogen debranching protein GlgX [Micavibrio sp.]